MGKVLAITPNFTVDILMTIPVLQVGEVHRATTTSKLPGGKGVNVARVIQQFGHAVEIAGFLGGFNGQFAQRQYDSEGFQGHYVWCDGETRDSILIAEPDGRSTVFNQQGMNVGPEQVLKFAEQVAAIRDQFDWVSISGSVPPGAPAEAYIPLYEAIRSMKLAVDSHGTVLAMFAARNLDLLKINGKEAGALLDRQVGTVEEAHEACIELHRRGDRIVAISLGALGAVGYDGKQCWHAKTPQVKVANNVGAGDGLFGAIIVALMEGQPFEMALRRGVATGAACCTVHTTGHFPPDVYDSLLHNTEVRLLS